MSAPDAQEAMASLNLSSAPPTTSTSSSPPSDASSFTNSSQGEGSAEGPRWALQPHVNGRPAIIEVNTHQPWYRRPGWLFVKAQLERSFATGHWSLLIWKLKYLPGGREYYMPVHIEQLFNAIPGHTTDPTLEEIENLNFLAQVSVKLQQEATERFNLARKRYEENHGHPWDPRRPPKASAAAATAAASSDEEDAKQSAPQVNEQKEQTELDGPGASLSQAR